jgi:hypothetical protein
MSKSEYLFNFSPEAQNSKSYKNWNEIKSYVKNVMNMYRRSQLSWHCLFFQTNLWPYDRNLGPAATIKKIHTWYRRHEKINDLQKLFLRKCILRWNEEVGYLLGKVGYAKTEGGATFASQQLPRDGRSWGWLRTPRPQLARG